MKNITKIVITGGPCGGKSIGVVRAKNYFEQQGYQVFVVPEAATILINGGITPKLFGMPYFQRKVMRHQIELNKIVERTAEDIKDKNVLILYDRSYMDGKAYLEDDVFDAMLESEDLTEPQILAEYDAVFHMVSTAKSCPEAYSTENNAARTEDTQKAAAIDDRTIAAWQNHSQFRIIEGEQDFEKKIQHLIDALSEVLEKNGAIDGYQKNTT